MTSEIFSPLLHLPNTYRAFFGGFSCLHPIQSEAVAPVLAGRDVVLQSATGSGKTEAVLAPCIERVIQAGHMEAVLYVVPTRALAIDLERRFTPILTQRLGLQFGIRTGDKKRQGGGCPDLILTTPESLDVLTGSSNPELQAFLQRVRMVIIDEVHPFLNQYRGRQLSFLLRRLERRTGCRVQKIALSATISDAEAVINFFGFRVDTVRLVSAMQRHITPNLVHLKGDEELPALLDDLYRLRGYRKILLFANSRGKCDQLLAITSRRGPFRKIAELHYSNLKPMERRTVEDRFRRREQALCIATSTLELGIDIGDVDCVLLFEPPDSVSSFLQRIGRSTRRQSSTNFWGICRGERPGEQLLRFLGLMRLARQGIVEAPLPNAFPSVLVQQVLSCLYEKKGISPASIRDLFPESSETIDLIFPEMEKQGYLRRDRLISQKFGSNHDGHPYRRNGLFRGGWRYREAFLDRGIWSNFPETEESYALEVSGEAVADLPRSIVRQLDPGDCVNLAGKPVKILEIVDSGERKRVMAESTEQPEGKEIYWLGSGFQVTFEVAQAMRAVLNQPEETEEATDSGLFARSLRLLRKERRKNARVATLANGIEVLREAGGSFRYRTFLGSVGNLILRFTAARDLAGRDGFFIRSDEIGITCSHWIDFRKLSLPVEPGQFRRWAAKNIRPLRLLLPFNVFADALPEALLVEELTGFLHDSRVSGHFKRYLSSASEIISGDIDAFELSPVEPEGFARVFEQSSASAPLLEYEKKRWGASEGRPIFELPAGARHVARPISGAMVGEYLKRLQCERFLSLQFLPPVMQPPRRVQKSFEPEARLTEVWRTLHGNRAPTRLRNFGAPLITIEEADGRGERRSVYDRFDETLHCLEALIPTMKPGDATFIAGAVFMVPSLLMLHFDRVVASASADCLSPRACILDEVEGAATPGLIRVFASSEGSLLEAGDISHKHYYSRQWPVAFHALLMKESVRSRLSALTCAVSSSGFLMLPPRRSASEPESHSFDLRPHLAAFPAIFQNMGEVISSSPAAADWRLQGQCSGCRFFEICYRQALREEDIQFLPGVSAGMLWKLRQHGLTRIEVAQKSLRPGDSAGAERFNASENHSLGYLRAELSPHQRERLAGSLEAVASNRISLRKSGTRLIPHNISTAIFLHLLQDPVSELPRVLGYRAMNEKGDVADAALWTILGEDDLVSAWQGFSQRFLKVWRQSVRNGKGPRIFHFGGRSWRSLRDWGESTGEADSLSFLWRTGRFHVTDLRRLLEESFYLPAPGRLTLFALGQILGFTAPDGMDGGEDDPMRPPISLFHADIEPDVSPETWVEDERLRKNAHRYVQSLLDLEGKIWGWARGHIESDLEHTGWDERTGRADSTAERYIRFLEEEKRLREEDVLALQDYSLPERVERLRAIGPLIFQGTSLDEEGRFVYSFSTPREGGLSKFREDDFLKLAPVGARGLQSGFPVILARYDHGRGVASVLSRQGRLALSKRLEYSLEEDITDWNHSKLVHVVESTLSPEWQHPVTKLLGCGWMNGERKAIHRAGDWLRTIHPPPSLDDSQRAALGLALSSPLVLLEGPPGTGKTHLLGWIIIALIMEAQRSRVPLRIAVSALTHRAIDGVLRKVADLVSGHKIEDFPARVVKWGRWKEDEKSGPGFNPGSSPGSVGMAAAPDAPAGFGVQPLEEAGQVREFPYLVLGATGFGLYNLFKGESGTFPPVFDWVIFDEASQVLVPHALLSLAYGKGSYIFSGDVKQLPPIVLGNHSESSGAGQSILAHLLNRLGKECYVRLDRTYRMNEMLCRFPSRMWYDGALHAAPGNAQSQLKLRSVLPHLHANRRESHRAGFSAQPGTDATPTPDSATSTLQPLIDARVGLDADLMDRILNPEKPVVLVLTNHKGCHQNSDFEAEIMSQLAHRLLVQHALSPEDLALISPHRAQNNAMAVRLRKMLGEDSPLPVIDTVERLQGAEKEVILFSTTTSDPDHVMSEFLNNPNRFNVAITRAKKKLVVVGSRAFFLAIPQDEEALRANRCFKEFYQFCRKHESLFALNSLLL